MFAPAATCNGHQGVFSRLISNELSDYRPLRQTRTVIEFEHRNLALWINGEIVRGGCRDMFGGVNFFQQKRQASLAQYDVHLLF